jgi:threonine dehydrogenase-like Zn-dependent dehydrogenase
MKAIVCEQPGQLRMKEMDPPILRPGEALVRIRRIGICGTDLHALKGEQPYFTYPRILGHELSGEIAELSDTTCGFKGGDPVAIIPYIECGKCIACRQGKVDATSFITHRVNFDKVISQFESWLKPETGVIKAMIEL